MDKDKLLELKSETEKRCEELFSQVQAYTTELERVRGEFRTYTKLLEEWVEEGKEELEGTIEDEPEEN